MNIPGKGAKKIRWSRGEAAEAVARRFLAENQLPESHLQETLQYVQLVMASAAPAAAAGSADYSYPAVDWSEEDGPVGRGGRKKIMISWKRGDDPVQVAQAFVRQHGYAAELIGDLTRFVQAMQDELGVTALGDRSREIRLRQPEEVFTSFTSNFLLKNDSSTRYYA